MPKIYGLSRNEKLKSVVRIEKLFTKGKPAWVFPFNVYLRFGSSEEYKENQFLVSVGKHFFKHAVDRNRMKRVIREAYRLNKQPLYDAAAAKGVCFNVGFVYKSRQLSDFALVSESMKKAIAMLAEKISES